MERGVDRGVERGVEIENGGEGSVLETDMAGK